LRDFDATGRRGKPHSLERENQGRSAPAVPGEKAFQNIKQARVGNSFFGLRKGRISIFRQTKTLWPEGIPPRREK
jgi:hypothetical protein